MKAEEQIEVYGARVHNLKNIDVNIPRNSLTVITGLSGSGKSSLAFDTIFAEGQRRYIETFTAYARNMLGDRRDNNRDIRFFSVAVCKGRGSILLFIGGKNGSLYRGENHFSDNGPIPE